MTESVVPEGQLKFKAPTSADWRALQVESQDNDQQEKTKAARDSLKETLLTSLQMQHIAVLAGSGTSLGPVGGPSMQDLWDAAIGKPPNQDAIATANVWAAASRVKSLPWMSQSGRRQRFRFREVDGMTVRDALRTRVPNSSWMTNPRSRDEITAWLDWVK